LKSALAQSVGRRYVLIVTEMYCNGCANCKLHKEKWILDQRGPVSVWLNNPTNVILRLARVPETFLYEPIRSAIATTPPYSQHIQSKTIRNMASSTIPRSAMRSLSRATPSLRSATPRIATRCLHQQASPITASRLQHRPTAQPWSQRVAAPSATVSRRTMFIQTEPTPNADVCTRPTPATPPN
jgi:hypothetical protein